MVNWFIKGLTEDALFPQLVIVIWLIAPTLWALYTRCFLLRKVEKQYRERLDEKDAQIKRLERRLATLYNRIIRDKETGEPEKETES